MTTSLRSGGGYVFVVVGDMFPETCTLKPMHRHQSSNHITLRVRLFTLAPPVCSIDRGSRKKTYTHIHIHAHAHS